MYLRHLGCVLGVMTLLIAFMHLSGRTQVRDWEYRCLGSIRA